MKQSYYVNKGEHPLTALYETVEGGWVQAQLQEIPGVITVAPSTDEARSMLTDALREYLLALGQAAAEPADQAARRETLALVIE